MRIHERDNVEVNVENGHKYALFDIKKGENIIKYGFPIGHATEDIAAGAHVHTHNVKTNLSEKLSYIYEPMIYPIKKADEALYFEGYERKNGDVGIRNEVWIVNTVGCVNKTAQRLAEMTGARYFPHPFGCSQLGDDEKTTQLILKGMVNHPNAAGVLVLGLGCENNHIGVFREVLGEYDAERVKFLSCQDFEDELAEGVRLIEELFAYASTFKRKKIPVSRLRVGLKCGGSDGYSGVTANPLVGAFSDLLIAHGGSSVLTEVPEMFGAEHLLFARCETRNIFEKAVNMVNGFKDYYAKNSMPVYENPSPGNKAGGITTLEEKSLGCVQKGGSAPVMDVLGYGDTVRRAGLSLLDGPGNDLVAITNLMAAGCHLILFTTGRGTPVGGAVPTVKIATNQALAEKKKNWIDFDASPLLCGAEMDALAKELFSYVITVASGEETVNEKMDFREISIFKSGVVL